MSKKKKNETETEELIDGVPGSQESTDAFIDDGTEEGTEEDAEVSFDDAVKERDVNGIFFDGNTAVRWKFDPDLVVILGLDDSCEEDDPLFDDNAKSKLDDMQVKSVARDGVLQDITITPRVIDGILRPVVVDGRHRTRWARKVNQYAMAPEMRYVHARCVGEDEDTRTEKHTLNYVRATRNILTQARAAKELKDSGRKNQDIAVDLGVSVSTVENLVALAGASKPVIDALNKGLIPPTAGYKLAKLSEEKQAEAVKETLALAKTNEPTGKGRAKVADAQAGKKRANGNKSAVKRPGIGKVRKLLDASREDEALLKALTQTEPTDFLRWLLGDVSDRVLPAELRLALKTAKPKPKPKAE